jgi:hypothetical protein
MRLLLSCGSEDICSSASDSSLDIHSKEFQLPPPRMVNEALRTNERTKQQESNCQIHQIESSKDKSDRALNEETNTISHEPAASRESNEYVADTSLNIETPTRGNRGRRIARRCSVTKYSLDDESSTEESKQSDESERSEKSCELLTHPRRIEQTNARPLTEPLSRLTSSRKLRPSLQKLWVSVSNIQVEARTTMKQSKHSEEERNACKEDHCPSVLGRATAGEETKPNTKFFQFSQLKNRSFRASRPQVQPLWSSFRNLRIEDKKHPKESETVPEGTEPPVQETKPKRNWPGMGRRGVASVVKPNLDDENGVHDKVSKELAEEEETNSHDGPRFQPILRSRGNRPNLQRRNSVTKFNLDQSTNESFRDRPKLQRRNSITKFNLDQATNESFRRRRPRMERRCSVTQFSLGVKEAQEETTSNCVFVAPKMSRPKLSRSGQATVLILTNENLGLSMDGLKRNVLAPNAA